MLTLDQLIERAKTSTEAEARSRRLVAEGRAIRETGKVAKRFAHRAEAAE